MPAIIKIDSPDGQLTGVWEITEPENELLKKVALTEAEKATLATFKATARRLQWLAVRALLQEFRTNNPVIEYKENGKPFFADHSEEISISHSGKLAAIALHASKTPGVDAEELHPRIHKIASRFINSEEQAYMEDNTLLEQLCTIWAAKEVLYKIHPKGLLSFRENFLISRFNMADTGTIKGTIRKGNIATEHNMAYKKVGNYILVYTNYATE
ncbi:MAG TPA: 4'-phosphopantetheinyl transferase superfamily protein [Bacteroidia bacterium]|jgi:4'-phosphopantetheinyl transferase|nr:4'-phosphopantetheinyl transferase superfamily protein [Bacteroidia bacterium]